MVLIQAPTNSWEFPLLADKEKVWSPMKSKTDPCLSVYLSTGDRALALIECQVKGNARSPEWSSSDKRGAQQMLQKAVPPSIHTHTHYSKKSQAWDLSNWESEIHADILETTQWYHSRTLSVFWPPMKSISIWLAKLWRWTRRIWRFGVQIVLVRSLCLVSRTVIEDCYCELTGGQDSAIWIAQRRVTSCQSCPFLKNNEFAVLP